MKLKDIKGKLDYTVKITTFKNVDNIVMLPDYEIKYIDDEIESFLKAPTKFEHKDIGCYGDRISLEALNSKILNQKDLDSIYYDHDDGWCYTISRNLTEKEIIKLVQDIINTYKARYISNYRDAVYIARVSKDFREDFANYNREEKLKRIDK